MSRKIDWRKEPCPNPKKGTLCPLCGGSYICLESNRPKVHEVKEREALKAQKGKKP